MHTHTLSHVDPELEWFFKVYRQQQIEVVYVTDLLMTLIF